MIKKRNLFTRVLCVLGAFFVACSIGISSLLLNPQGKPIAKAEVGYTPIPSDSTACYTIDHNKFFPFYTVVFFGNGTGYGIPHAFYLCTDGNGLLAIVQPSNGSTLIQAIYNPSTSAFVFYSGSAFSCLVDITTEGPSSSEIKVNNEMDVSIQYQGILDPDGNGDRAMHDLSFSNSFMLSFFLPLMSSSGGKMAPGFIVNSYFMPVHMASGNSPAVDLLSVSIAEIKEGGGFSEAEYFLYGQRQFEAGQSKGFEQGYERGLEVGNDSNFLSLLTAVVDVPVSAFSSLLDFEILGVNMRGFVLGLLTVAFLVAVLRFIL